MRVVAHRTLLCVFSGGLVGLAAWFASSPDFTSAIPEAVERVWVGPDYYANRLQDWRIRAGRIECVTGATAKPMRTLHLLTRTLGEAPGSVHLSVRTGPIEPGEHHEDTWSGFLIGVGAEAVDFRISALAHHWPSDDGGLIVAVDGTGRIVVRDNSLNQGYAGPDPAIPLDAWAEVAPLERTPATAAVTDLVLTVEIEPDGDAYAIDVRVHDPATGAALGAARYTGIPAHQVSGNVALASHRSPARAGPGYWFRDWTLSGSKVERHDDRSFGPIMGTLYTLSRGTLKMTAQMGPLGEDDTPTVALEVRRDGTWTEVARASIQPLSATAHLRVDGWTANGDTPYRVVYDLAVGGGRTERHLYEGVIRRPPVDRSAFVLAGLTGHNISGGDGGWNGDHFWYPHTDLTDALRYHDPDLLFFSGDQIYEGGLEGVVRSPLDEAALDYLGHWYRFVWAFRDLTRERPTVTIPDDHDMYHGNIWGNGGVRLEGDHTIQDRGGYRMPAEWVNAVHRTQVAHLPDPVDPEPLVNGVTTYHTRLEYAGISFAIIADRMWKSPPSPTVPAGQVVNGWPQNPNFDAATEADVPGAVLLGERQERFLDDWTGDWSDGAWMKVLLSQTPFVDVATIPADAMSGAVIPGLAVAQPGEYVEGDKKASDMDSNGWPQTPRNRALRILRKGFAFHVAGDQHLASFTQYGVDAFRDAGHAFAVPAIANIWPRRWYPPEPGTHRAPGAPRYTGDFFDGLGNRMTVLAVANPTRVGVAPAALYERAPGYGIIRFNRETREIVSECWPRWVDPSAADAEQYPGWPIRVRQEDNYGRAAAAYLPTVATDTPSLPVLQVVDEASGEILYTLRLPRASFRPPVFDAAGRYTVRVRDPDRGIERVYEGVTPAGSEAQRIEVGWR